MTHPPAGGPALAGAAALRPPRRRLATPLWVAILWPGAVVVPIALGAPPAVAIACVAAALAGFLRATLFGGPLAERAERRARFRVGPMGGAWPLAMLAAGVVVVASASLHVVAPAADVGGAGQERIDAYMALGPLHAAAVLFAGALAAPIMEEIAFRGALATALARRFGEPVALVGSSFLFAVVHVQPTVLPQLVFAGGMLGLLAWGARSVWASALAHVIWNAVALSGSAWPHLAIVPERVPRSIAFGSLLASVVAFAWLIVRLRRASARPVDHPNPGDR